MNPTPATVLSPTDIATELAGLPGWVGDAAGLRRTLKFTDFAAAIRFMAACVPEIERLNHHPVWTNVYDTVEIRLDTADAGHRVTRLDIELARAMERIAAATG